MESVKINSLLNVHYSWKSIFMGHVYSKKLTTNRFKWLSRKTSKTLIAVGSKQKAVKYTVSKVPSILTIDVFLQVVFVNMYYIFNALLTSSISFIKLLIAMST
jgi:hypothetical protein